MEHNESTPSLVGANVRNVTDHDEYDKGQTSPTKAQPLAVHHDDSHKEYTSVNELAVEGALINDEQEYGEFLDATGKVIPNISKPSAVISGVQNDKLSQESKNKIIEDAVLQPVQIDESHNDFVVVDIPHHPSVDVADAATPVESSGTPSIYELKNTDSGMSLEDLIDSQMASMTSMSSDLQKKLNKRKSALPAANSSRSASRLRNVVETAIPDSVIENDSMQQVPAGLREGMASPLVQSRSQSVIRSIDGDMASREKPHLARGDSYSGVQTYEARPGRRVDRGDGFISNLSSREYLRSVSRSRSRMGKETTLSNQDLTEEGALVTDDLDHDPEMIHKLDETLEEVEEDDESKAAPTFKKSIDDEATEPKSEDKSVDFSEEDSLDAITKKLEDVLREASPIKKLPMSPKKIVDEPIEEPVEEISQRDVHPEAENKDSGLEDKVEEVYYGKPAEADEQAKDNDEHNEQETSTLSDTAVGIAAATGLTATASAIVSAVKGVESEETTETPIETSEEKAKDSESDADKDIDDDSTTGPASLDGIKEPPTTEVDSPAEPATTEENTDTAETSETEAASIVTFNENAINAAEDGSEESFSDKAAADVLSSDSTDASDMKEEEPQYEVDSPTQEQSNVPDADEPVAALVTNLEEFTGDTEKSTDAQSVKDITETEIAETQEEAKDTPENVSLDSAEVESSSQDAGVEDITESTNKLSIGSPVADETERLINELEADIGEVSMDTSTKDLTAESVVDTPEERDVPSVDPSTKTSEEKEVELLKEEPVVSKVEVKDESKDEETHGRDPATEQVKEESDDEELHEPTRDEIIEMLKDEPVYLYTSLAGGGFLMPQRTNRLATILTANRITFTYRDLGTDEEARNVWRRYGKGRVPPGIVRGKDDIIGNWEEIEEANEDYRVRELIYETL